MTTDKRFCIEVSSNYGEWWRYNVALMCGCFDTDDHRTGFASSEDHIADAGSNFTEKPAGIPDDRRAVLETPPCDHLLLYIYIVPHTHPVSRDVAHTRPFDIDLCITHGGQTVLTEKRSINQWSGASIELRVGRG